MSSTRYTKKQKEAIATLRSTTGCSEKVAIDCLKISTWNIETAADYFYAHNLSSTVVGVDPRAVDSLFNKYKDKDGDAITADGIVQFCSDLGVEPADPVVLVVAFHMNAVTMGEFTKEEFSQGLLKLNCDNIDKLRRKLPELRAELSNEDRFRDLYQFAYGFSCEKGQKCVQQDVAIGMWQLLLGSVKPWSLLDDWVAFLTKHHNRAISKDTWNQLFDFIKTVKADMSNYDDNSAWPYLLDEFKEFIESKKAVSAAS